MSKDNDASIRFTLRSVFVATAAVAIVFALGLPVLPLVGAACVVPYLWKKGQTGWAGMIVAWLLICPLLGVGITFSLRLDAGDLRTEVWGIPMSWSRTHEPARSELLALKGADSRRRWQRVYQTGSHNVRRMIRQFYVDATAWVDVDPEIARFIVADIASYAETERTAPEVPFCVRLIRSHVIDRSTGTARVLDGWEQNPDVLAYLTQKGYNPRSATSAGSTPLTVEQTDQRASE